MVAVWNILTDEVKFFRHETGADKFLEEDTSLDWVRAEECDIPEAG